MDKKIFQIPAILNKYESKANKSVKITFTTQENIPADLLAVLFSFIDNSGWLNFAVREIEAKDLIKLPPIEPNKNPSAKSKSQLLRAVIFRIHEQNGGNNKNFIDYYNKTMDMIIDKMKEKLE